VQFFFFFFNCLLILNVGTPNAVIKTNKWRQRGAKIKLQKVLIKRNPQTSDMVTMKGY
jgi:hypothetical protein